MDIGLFGSDLWKTALDKYAEVTGLSVTLFGVDEREVLSSERLTPLVALLQESGFDPGLYAECARRCLSQTDARPAVVVTETHFLTVVGTSLALEGTIVGAAVAGYAIAGFSQVTAVQRWAQASGVPFERLWDIARRQSPVPERRLKLHGELLQILGDALLRENHRTRLYEDSMVRLQMAAAVKDDFLAVLSHELRTPLAPITSWANVLKVTKSMEHVHKAAEAIERNAMLQARMIDDLLDVDRISRDKIELDLGLLELSGVIGAAVETSTSEIEKKGIRVEVVYPGEVLCVEGDTGRLQQVFRNILTNAVKFTPAGGAIHVSLGREGGSARVAVADTGRGIEPEFLPFMFEMFRQQERGTRREYGGMGIGLGVVKRLVELHGGTVSAASAGAGQGAEIVVLLPLAIAAPAIPDPVAPALPASTLAGLSVLVIEDSEDARESLSELLQVLGARVSVARDGREALDRIADAAPDLVLCDLRMPRMDGFEFMHEFLRGSASVHPPVVAMSGFTSDEDRKRTREAGFEGHIAKPFGRADIVAAVGAAFSQRTRH